MKFYLPGARSTFTGNLAGFDFQEGATEVTQNHEAAANILCRFHGAVTEVEHADRLAREAQADESRAALEREAEATRLRVAAELEEARQREATERENHRVLMETEINRTATPAAVSTTPAPIPAPRPRRSSK